MYTDKRHTTLIVLNINARAVILLVAVGIVHGGNENVGKVRGTSRTIGRRSAFENRTRKSGRSWHRSGVEGGV